MRTVEITEAVSQLITPNAAPANITMDKSLVMKHPSASSLKLATRIGTRSDELMDELKSLTHVGRSVGLAGKRLSSRHLARIGTRDLRVFSRKSHAMGIDTAVTLALDCSGSMSADLDDITRQEAVSGLYIGLADVLDEYQVSFSALAYCEKLTYCKQPEDDWSTMRKGLTVPAAQGGTLTGAALTTAVGDLALLPQERKVLILITDGDTTDEDLLDSAYAEAVEQNIQVVTLLITTPGQRISRYLQKVAKPCHSHSTVVEYTINAVRQALS